MLVIAENMKLEREINAFRTQLLLLLEHQIRKRMCICFDIKYILLISVLFIVILKSLLFSMLVCCTMNHGIIPSIIHSFFSVQVRQAILFSYWLLIKAVMSLSEMNTGIFQINHIITTCLLYIPFLIAFYNVQFRINDLFSIVDLYIEIAGVHTFSLVYTLYNTRPTTWKVVFLEFFYYGLSCSSCMFIVLIISKVFNVAKKKTELQINSFKVKVEKKKNGYIRHFEKMQMDYTNKKELFNYNR